MKRRSSEILQYLSTRETDKIFIKDLSNKYNVSDKTLKRDLNEINQFLAEIKIEPLSIKTNGEIILFDRNKYPIVLNELMQIGNFDYVMSQHERCFYIIVIFLKQNDFITMNTLADILCVTRITILNDMPVVNKILEKYNIKIITRPGIGIKISADEYALRLMAVSILKKSFFESNKEFEIANIFYYKLVKELTNNYEIGKINKALKNVEKNSKIKFSGKGFRTTLYYLFIVFNRNKDINISDISFEENSNFKSAKNIFESVCESIGEKAYRQEEIACFAKFIHEKKVFIPSTDMNDYSEIYAMVTNFLYAVSIELNVSFYDDYSLFEFISLHFSSMAERIRNEESSNNELKDILKNEYPKVFSAVEKNIYLIEDFYSIKIDENEISYIVMHLCADLERRKTRNNKLSACIICPESIATGQLIRAQAEKYFNLDIKNIITVNHLAEEYHDDVDFVLSTVVIPPKKVPVLFVSPILSSDDLNNIQTLIFSLIKSRDGEDNVNDINIDISYRLYQAINPDLIILENNILKWEDALTIGGNLLIDNKYTWEGFTKAIIKSMEINGPYFVMTKGVAIAHTLCMDSSYENAVSLVINEKGINFGHKDNDPVKLIFCLSIKESKAYLTILKELLSLGKEREFFNKLITAKNNKEAYKIIKEESLKLKI